MPAWKKGSQRVSHASDRVPNQGGFASAPGLLAVDRGGAQDEGAVVGGRVVVGEDVGPIDFLTDLLRRRVREPRPDT